MRSGAAVGQTLSCHGRLRGLRAEQQPGPWVFADFPRLQEMGIVLSHALREHEAFLMKQL